MLLVRPVIALNRERGYRDCERHGRRGQGFDCVGTQADNDPQRLVVLEVKHEVRERVRAPQGVLLVVEK